VHLAGVRLTVRGLAFNSKTPAFSACATTALWSAFQRVRVLEDIASATPAQITLLSARYTLPFGKAMPSEGLSIDQMCQAVQAIGVAPNLYRLERLQPATAYSTALGFLYSSIKSGAAPVLILRRNQDECHAVTAVGMETRNDPHTDAQPRGAWIYRQTLWRYLPMTTA